MVAANDVAAVVEALGRVHEINGLRVTDASIFFSTLFRLQLT